MAGLSPSLAALLKGKPDDREPDYRMSMLPFGTYANPDGSESLGLALPGMIKEPLNALQRLAQNSVMPDGRIGIPNPQNPDNQHDVLTGLLSLYGGNAMNPGRLLEGAAGRVAEAPAATRIFSDTGKPSILGATIGGADLRPLDDWQYIKRSADMAPGRGPFDINRPYVMHGDAPIDEADRMFAQLDQHIPVDMPHNEVSAFDTPYDRAVAERAWYDKIKRTGELFSDTGRPSLMGSALAGANDAQNPPTLSQLLLQRAGSI